MNVDTPRRSLTSAIVPALAVAGLAGLGTLLIVNAQNNETAVSSSCVLENADGVGGPIDLVDGAGARVTQANFAGEPAVIYFGFTHCPDVCPTSMYSVNEALAASGVPEVQPILITVDPERDTPQRMQEYANTEGFPAELVGLSGSRAQIDAAIAAFHVYAMRRQAEGAPVDAYNMDHTSYLYVVDEHWRTRSIMLTMRPQDPTDPRSPIVAAPPEEIAACIRAGLGRS